ncbi:CC0125/CC1285 family lipoprotein [Litorimonas sp. RW-G-Af-16]|uniref:CC0125/CC1285 family lipoprotein n=1 Tax=Litorimonas sp. RW-G-Af-16 TaxID=3241168 RepID=UPI00390CA52A
MKLLRQLALGASVVVLTACATATPYQPASKPGGFDGFSQTMIENDRARVTFGGNSLTKRDTVENYLLYRAAEVAIERGFDYFVLEERDVEQNKRVSVRPGIGAGYGGLYDPYFNYSFYRGGYGWSRPYRYSHFGGFRRYRGFGYNAFYDPFYDPFFNDIDVREITKYRATAEVKFGKGPKPRAQDNAFNAREVIQNLGPTITFPEAKA